MGKSLGNYIGVGEPAYDQFAKTMSIPDDADARVVRAADRPAGRGIAAALIAARIRWRRRRHLGRDIVRFYHGEVAAEEAAAEWKRRFSDRQDPREIREVDIPPTELQDGRLGIVRLLILTGLAKGSNDAHRAVEGGGVTIGDDRQKIADPKAMVTVTDGLIVRIGRRNVVRVQLP